MLLEEGYIAQDCIYFAEYCNYVIDDEYIDGRMTWEPIKVKWIRK